MPTVLAELTGGLPLVMPLAAAAGVGLRGKRRRRGLNEALHELRRPLQALVLTLSPSDPGGHAVQSSLRMTEAAMARLDREINGGSWRPSRERVRIDLLLMTAASRWEAPAARAGVELGVRCATGGATVEADPHALAQALDNLVVNAIEHGASPVRLEASVAGGRLRLAVIDAGRGPVRPPIRRLRFAGRRRHGHGLRVVRRTAAAHGGSFRIGARRGRNEAVVELPVGDGGAG